jgi:hypothetical protein
MKEHGLGEILIKLFEGYSDALLMPGKKFKI